MVYAAFPESMDDRVWLASDFFLHPPPPPSSASAAALLPHNHRSSSSSFSDAFFRHLVTLSLNKQSTRPPGRSSLLDSLYQMQRRGKVSSFHGFGAELHHHHPHHHHQLLRPSQLQVACYLENTQNRNRVLRRKHQDNIFPSQGSSSGSKAGYEKVSGGTGVFHPKVLSSSTTTDLETRMKQGLRSGEAIKAIQQRIYPLEGVGLGKGEYSHHLPQDWTY